ncbi:hypothetical protein COW81_00635 [Candidatus Campbellbacteria bacterium CG22_combo_CG10-13_8_21_14_all_36_13]|uniref:TIGR00341 family protein n=1 Tax=Candidatus Campbellbacteria bacterium CG22_combo_CG10-13_8_21_14_all_36_13 TaxID=1974529 RepID=A0A2H0DZQ6_9BACT|nr:MAG: hypothetical protein COW81_00635 [Candidatus Campbellbacteria bacterium CG22_combo_CG10-13_8_21_14_all_36_13]
MSTKSVLGASFFDKKKTIETLIEESRVSATFYLYLSFGAFISALGLLLDNPIVIVGAMLIAPILFPILSLGMGIVTSSRDAIRRSLKNLFKSSLITILIAFITSFLVNKPEITHQLVLVSTPNFLFFLVAFFSGIIAAFSWVKQDASSTLPGIAITVSLVPPLSAIGVAISLLSRDVFAGSMMLFLMNLIGIVLASILVFSLFGFSGLQKLQDKKIQEEEREETELEARLKKEEEI